MKKKYLFSIITLLLPTAIIFAMLDRQNDIPAAGSFERMDISDEGSSSDLLTISAKKIQQLPAKNKKNVILIGKSLKDKYQEYYYKIEEVKRLSKKPKISDKA